MRLYIIRHGETEWNRQKRLQGQSDVALNEYGRQLARVTAGALSDVEFDLVYSSPLGRAHETAQILVGKRDVEIIKDDNLMEISFGVDEGVPSEKLGEHFTNFFFAPEKYVPSEGGETYEELCKRAETFLKERIYPLRSTQKTVLIVAHGAMNKALMLNLKHIGIKDFWKGEFQKNCCVNVYELTGDTLTVIEEARIYYEGEAVDYLKNN